MRNLSLLNLSEASGRGVSNHYSSILARPAVPRRAVTITDGHDLGLAPFFFLDAAVGNLPSRSGIGGGTAPLAAFFDQALHGRDLLACLLIFLFAIPLFALCHDEHTSVLLKLEKQARAGVVPRKNYVVENESARGNFRQAMSGGPVIPNPKRLRYNQLFASQGAAGPWRRAARPGPGPAVCRQAGPFNFEP